MGLVHMWGGLFCGLIRDPRAALEHAVALRRMAVNQPVWNGLADMFTGQAFIRQGNWRKG